jgi:type IV secretory pathway TraG/TraD family ATPase VirD4
LTATKILWGQITAVFLIVLCTTWGATQWTAWCLGFQPQLGAPWFELAGKGRERYEGFIEALGRRLQKGQSLLHEIPEDVGVKMPPEGEDSSSGQN